jgi:hypothetical protein
MAARDGLAPPSQPIDSPDRTFAARRLGRRFDHVRLHTGPAAQSSAQRLQARAWTLGGDIVFGADLYQPGGIAYRHLLLHELVHVLQQGEPSHPLGAAAVGPADAAPEIEADRVARSVASQPPRVPPQVSAAPALVRRAIKVDPPTQVDENPADRVANGGETLGFVLILLNGDYINRKDDPVPRRKDVRHGGGPSGRRAVSALNNASFSSQSAPDGSGYTARVTAVPTNVLATELHVPSASPWQTMTTGEQMQLMLHFPECVGPTPCSLTVHGEPDDPTLRAATIAHEQLHVRDIEAAFQQIVGGWDARLQQAMNNREEFSAATPQEVNAELSERLGGLSDEIAVDFVKEVDVLGRRLHRQLKDPMASLSRDSVTPDCRTVHVKIAGACERRVSRAVPTRGRARYGPNVNANARTPGSLVTRVSTCRMRAAPTTRRIMPDRSKRATPSAPTSAPRASLIGFPSSSTVTAALPAGPGCMTRFTSPAVNGSTIFPAPFRSSTYWRSLRQSPSSVTVPGWRRSAPM